MAKRVYTRRYSQAIFQIALEKNELDRWQSDLSKIAAVLGDAALLAAIENPKQPFDAKAKILSQTLGDVSPLALNLVYLLVSKGRLSKIGEIAEDYHRLLDNYRGIEHAEVVTAVPLDESDKAKLGERLGAVVGKKVIITPEVDPSLIGGVVARVGGKLLDGSTRSRLQALKRELSGVGK